MSQGGEKTERATPKKRRDARERGEVRKSVELNTALLIVLSFAVLSMVWGSIAEQAMLLMKSFLDPAVIASPELAPPDLVSIFIRATAQFALILLPILAVAIVGGVLVNYLQVGFLFTTKTLAPKFSKINPFAGFKRIFSVTSVVTLLKSLMKVLLIVVLCYGDIEAFLLQTSSLMFAYPVEAIDDTMRTAFSMGLKIGLAMLIIGVADFLYTHWKYEKDMRMTKQEIKDEYKQQEGDPKIKGKIRQKQRQMAAMRMMQSVPDADVVITNPTHYAVALRYDEKIGSAPVVLAKGKDFVALKIKEIAKAHRVETVENRALAQSLYASCEVGDPIPETLYQAVAEILAMVYNLKKPVRRGGRRA